nr:MAG TPA: hypothetical protein [Caudoviricetes sp.]
MIRTGHSFNTLFLVEEKETFIFALITYESYL